MDNIFIIKLILSFFIGGTWIILVTVLADRFGSKIGGLIAGLPSTVLFGLFFIAWTSSYAIAVQATTIIPILSGVTCIFLLVYICLVRFNFWLSLICSLFIWLMLSLGLVFLKFNDYRLSIIGYVLLFFFSYTIIEYVLKIKSVTGRRTVYRPLHILLRGLLSGFIIAFSVLMGKLGGPIWGGMFSTFPAMFTSTILITYFSQGASFSAATMKSTMLSSVSVVIYAILVRYTYVPLGIVWGTLISIILSFISAFFLYNFIIKKLS